MDMGPTKRSYLWAWILGFVALLVVAGVGTWYYVAARPLTVPDVTGKLGPEAVQSLNDAGLTLGETSETPTSSAAPGVVIDQKPAAGTTLKPGEMVSIVMAAPPESSAVPNVTGQQQEQAQAALAQARLGSVVVETYNATASAGVVVSQIPSAGVEMVPGATVALAVSKGAEPAQVTVPKLTGLTEQDAATLLSSNELRGAAYRALTASVTAGEVASQTPAPGSRVAPNTTVQYLVSTGKGSVTVSVPDTVGMKSADAQKKLKDAGLKVETKAVPNKTVAKDKVTSQMPLAGSKVAPGTTVGLLVSKGPVVTEAVPSVVGKAKADAAAAVEGLGFTALFVPVPIEGQTPGTVYQQWPAAGAQWAPPFPVIMLLVEAPA